MSPDTSDTGASYSAESQRFSGSLDHSRLPAEIWLAVFAMAYDEIRLMLIANPTKVWSGDLRNVTLTCRRFYALAQPHVFRFLFVSFPTRPGDETSSDAYRLCRQEHYDRTVKRLQFYASPRIAHAVQTCHIKNLSGARDDEFSAQESEHARPMLDAFFETLPRLSNMKDFRFDDVTLSGYHLAQLSRFSRLHSVSFTNCDVEAVDLPSPLPIDRLHMTRSLMRSTSSQSRMRQALGIAAFNPKSLRTLSLWDRPLFSILLNNVLASSWPCLLSLSVVLEPSSSEAFCSFLSRCPMIKALTVRVVGATEGIASPPLTALPALESFTGPHQLLEPFTRGRSVRQLILGILGPKIPTSILMPCLLRCANLCAQLVTLEIHIKDLSRPFLVMIGQQCTRLRALSVDTVRERLAEARIATLEGLAEALDAVDLPSSIEYLSLNTDFSGAEEIVNRAMSQMKCSLSRYLALRYVRIVAEVDGKGFIFEDFDPSGRMRVRRGDMDVWRDDVLLRE